MRRSLGLNERKVLVTDKTLPFEAANGAALSPNELEALHNLAAKQAGGDVNWINIADARALTELGLARRTRAGWEITPEGAALVRVQPKIAQPPTLVK